MCRYAFKRYKVHFVCFNCRKTFKKPPPEDLAMKNGDWEDYQIAFWLYSIARGKKFAKDHPGRLEYLIDKYKNRKEKCPQCGELMADMGLDFRAPKKEKAKEWEIIRGLYKSGKAFHTCGCDGIGYVPKNERDYKEYLLEKRQYYKERVSNRDEGLEGKELAKYISRFDQLIKMIDDELERVLV